MASTSRYKRFTLYKCEEGYWVYRASGSIMFPKMVEKGTAVVVATPGESAGWTTGAVKGVIGDDILFTDFITDKGSLYRLVKNGMKITEEGEIR